MDKIIKRVRNAISNEKGFTLLEMILVILIMGFLVSMAAPIAGHITDAKRENLTKEELQNIKTSIIGSDKAYDENGFIIVGGYVGDMGNLPKLYKSEWDTSNNIGKWIYTFGVGAHEEINDGTGQPIGMYESKIADDDLGEAWKGPYITYPKDTYPKDGEGLDPINDKELFERKNNDGKYSDAWGNTLLFYKEYEYLLDESSVTLWLISRGKDGKVKMPTSGGSYDENEPENIDNISIKITPNEWYRAYHIGKEKQTKETLEKIRKALIGSFKNSDEDGRKLIRGYIGDTDSWPKIYKIYQNGEWEIDVDGKKVEVNYATEWGQPLSLWENIESNTNWKGPYIEYPWKKYLEDSWGKPLKFSLQTNPSGNDRMTVASAGYDGLFGTDDDISINIDKDEWKTKDISINDEKKVKSTKELLNKLEVALLGPKDAKDASGRRIVAGYLGDMGKWPSLYKIENVDSEWNWKTNEGTGKNTEIDYDTEWGQPINLWVKENITPISQGFGWKGAYFLNPYNEVIKDPWGEPLRFEMDKDISIATSMTIISAGIDGIFGDDEEGKNDDISTTIAIEDWKREVTIEGTIFNNSSSSKTVNLEFFNTPTTSQSTTVEVQQLTKDADTEGNTRITGGQQKFTITTDAHFGLRTLKLTGGLDEEIEIFIGKGGTQSPTKDNLKIFIK